MPTSDRIGLLLGRVLAMLALGAALLLSWPGVRAVRADEPDMTPIGPADLPLASDPAGSCEDAPARPAPRVGSAEARAVPVPPTMRPGEPGVEAHPGVVLLNNRGYNYGGSAGPSPAQWLEIEREMQPEAD